MSMSAWLGGFGGVMQPGNGEGADSPPWRLYHKFNDLSDPGPAQTALLLDERSDTITSGNFLVDMSGYLSEPQLTQFNWDMPASYHVGAGGLSFADGHTEIKMWRDPRTTPALHNFEFTSGQIPCPNNADIVWLQERATRLLQH
jgi:hypothetical protein